MLNKRLFTAPIAAGVLLASVMPTAANAAMTVFNSVSGIGSIGTAPVGYSSSASSSFSVGATQNFTLTGVELILSGDSGNTGGAITVSLIRDNGSNEPDLVSPAIANLGTLSDTLLTNTLSSYAFSSFAPVHLNSGARYWINVVPSGNSTAQWSYEADDSGFGVAGEFYSNPTDGTFPNSFGAQQMMVSGVPEPTSVALMGLGLAVISAGRLRRKIH